MSDLQTTNFPSVREKAVGAMLAFACGDAAGWPFEDRANAIDRPRRPDSVGFSSWTKRSGGRFRLHEEPVLAGEYSDDTQLTLCTARSVLNGAEWFQRFARVELPTWSIYQRGAGGATLRAVDSWLFQMPPWSSRRTPAELRAYAEAGGNGAAMRIAPHVLTHVGSRDFSKCAIEILTNSIATHGHPRALIGALLFGYAMWRALRQQSSWPYGGLLAEAINDVTAWSAADYLRHLPSEWLEATTRTAPRSYNDLWKSVTSEVVDMLHATRELLTSQGALLDDADVLSRIGALDKRTNGAGTVTACGAIYFAARYAAEPLAGLRAAAVAERADTDTLAAMSGAVLGAINGTAWLGRLSDTVQDSEYLTSVAVRLLDRVVELRAPTPVKKSLLTAFTASLSDPEADVSRFPDGRLIDEITSAEVTPKSKSTNVLMWRCRLADGQTVYVKRYEKWSLRQTDASTKTKSAAVPPAPLPLLVSDLLDQVTREVWSLQYDWRNFKFVSADDPFRVDVLNATAPAFFYRWQQLMYERMLLGIGRLFDPSHSGPHVNVSLATLAESFSERFGASQSQRLSDAVRNARRFADGCIQHSRKRIVHRDHHVHSTNARTLPPTTLKLIEDALAQIRTVVEVAYEIAGRGSVSFDVPLDDGDIQSLLRRLINRRSQKHPELPSSIVIDSSSRSATLLCAFCGESVAIPYYPDGTPPPQVVTRWHYDTCDGVVGCETIRFDVTDAAGTLVRSFKLDLKVPTRKTE